jgi:hypothetical protein
MVCSQIYLLPLKCYQQMKADKFCCQIGSFFI